MPILCECRKKGSKIDDEDAFDSIRSLAIGFLTIIFFHFDSVSVSIRNGWHVPTLQKALDQCTGQLFNDLEKCPPLVETLDRNRSQSCSVKPLIKEKVEGTLKTLPGCNPIKNGPNKGKGAGSSDCVNTTSSSSIPKVKSSSKASKLRSSATSSSNSSLTKAQKQRLHRLGLKKHGKKMSKSVGKSRPTTGVSDV